MRYVLVTYLWEKRATAEILAMQQTKFFLYFVNAPIVFNQQVNQWILKVDIMLLFFFSNSRLPMFLRKIASTSSSSWAILIESKESSFWSKVRLDFTLPATGVDINDELCLDFNSAPKRNVFWSNDDRCTASSEECCSTGVDIEVEQSSNICTNKICTFVSISFDCLH